MKRLISFLIILGVFFVSFITTISALDFSDNRVKDFTVDDLPHDDGSGLLLSWIPLPREKRIIEYRIYRGITPDSLFYIGQIEVDPKLGVVSPRLYYYDRDFTEFVSLYSPASLKKEVQQPPDSPLYREMPRDISIYSRYLNHYSVLGVINKDDFYYRSQPVEMAELDETENEVKTVYAGLTLRSFEGLYSMLLPEKPYYYTVVAVDQQRRFHPPSEIVEGIAYDNPPEEPREFAAVILSDLQKMQFEWLNPIFEDDIYLRNVYLLTENLIPGMEAYIAQEKRREEILNRQGTNTEEEGADPATDFPNPALHILASPTAFPYSSTITGYLESSDGKISILNGDELYPVAWNDLEQYRFVFSFTDYSGYESFSEIVEPQIRQSRSRPVLPEYIIQDKPDDKGDYNQLLFGKPLVFMTQGGFLNQERTKLSLNYDYTDNRVNRLKSIVFKFYDSRGSFLTEVYEFLPDKMIKVSIPSFELLSEGLLVEIVPTFNNEDIEESYLLTQKMFYNDEFGFIEYSELENRAPDVVNDGEFEIVSEYSYYLYKRAKADREFRLARAISPFARLFDDSIPYETSIFKMVSKYDLEKNLLLVDSSIGITFDRERDTEISTNIFLAEIENDITRYQKQITALENELTQTEDDEASAWLLSSDLEYYRNLLWMQTEHPLIAEANKITPDRKRMKYLADVRERDKRSFEYIFIKSDGKALFYQDDIYDQEDETYIFPTPDWFTRNMFPALIATLVFGLLVFLLIRKAMAGDDMFIRPIAGLEEIDNAIGRATEMGKPILFVPGIGYIEDIATLAALSILSNVARKAAEYDTKVMVPVADYIVLPVAMETVKEAHVAAGRPDTFNRDDIFYISGDQFAFVAGVNGIMVRQKTVANFFLGVFFAEALIMTETGNAQGAIQIAGSDSITQIPFFIATCDYTLIGEELYGASAYLAREPLMTGTLKAQDYTKVLILAFIIAGTILSSFRLTFLINAFPAQ
jgi:nitrous oxide reductase accessory protein NosL